MTFALLGIVFGLGAVALVLSLPMRLALTATLDTEARVLTVTGRVGPFQRRFALGPKRGARRPPPLSWAAFRAMPRVTVGVARRFAFHLWRHLLIEEFTVSMTVGCREAARTAWWVGTVSAAMNGAIETWIAPRALTPPRLTVVPAWHDVRLSGQFTSIIRVKPSNVIVATARAFWGR
ncbi:MAG: hypothetical protein OWU84_01605 [Firmicutes bacterium]|nr:hypothetical protein [Bacillota bacterium]